MPMVAQIFYVSTLEKNKKALRLLSKYCRDTRRHAAVTDQTWVPTPDDQTLHQRVQGERGSQAGHAFSDILSDLLLCIYVTLYELAFILIFHFYSNFVVLP